jgi:hypothetical protein
MSPTFLLDFCIKNYDPVSESTRGLFFPDSGSWLPNIYLPIYYLHRQLKSPVLTILTIRRLRPHRG